MLFIIKESEFLNAGHTRLMVGSEPVPVAFTTVFQGRV